jgi:hypothetical protein
MIYQTLNLLLLRRISYQSFVLLVGLMFFLTGCSTTLVNDPVRQVSDQASHCSGSESVDNSSIAVLPVPFVAFFVPHVDLNDVNAEDHLKNCGESSKLKNRQVEVSRTACIPAGLTRIITLGVWQWCPAEVSWEADVTDS